jgi:hypothetical protein
MVTVKSKSSSSSSSSPARTLVWVVAVLIAFVVGVQFGLTSSMRETIWTDLDAGLSRAVKLSSEVEALLGWSGRETYSRSALKGSYTLAHQQSYGYFDDIDDYNWKMMQDRAMQRNNHKFNDPVKFREEPARWYMNNYEPDFTCAQERRVGGPGDGPKWVRTYGFFVQDEAKRDQLTSALFWDSCLHDLGL